uniref:Expressed protein n=1 Tax=Oryza sativa subsp. japonica TaxID=39947 RepID=Q2QX55_ORYSJ|nr:expressed protein [Oryza sativa Japonica Group]
MHGGGVRDGEERRRGGVDGGDAPGARDEVHRARGHGWCAGYLRPHHRSHHQHGDQPQGQALLPPSTATRTSHLASPVVSPVSLPEWPLASLVTPESGIRHFAIIHADLLFVIIINFVLLVVSIVNLPIVNLSACD